MVVLAVVVFPILWTVVLAFQDLRLIDLRRRGLFGEFTLDNFAAVFGSPGFWAALRTTLLLSVVGTVSSIGIGLAAALALRGAFRGRTFVRASMLLPYVAPVVAVTFVWQTMLSPQFGIVNAIGMEVFGWDDPIAFLSQRSADVTVLGIEITVPVALLTVMAFEAWRYFPFAFLFLTARMQAMPRDLEKAAQMDGATISQRFRYVVFPQLLPTIALLALLRFIFTFNEFDDVYLLTGGGAGTQVVSVRVYDLLDLPRRRRRGVGAGPGARAHPRGARGAVLPVRRPPDGRSDVTRTAPADAAPTSAGRTGSTCLEPRPRGDPGVRGAALGRHRRAPGGDAVPDVLHGGAVAAQPGRGGAASRAAVARRVRLEHLRTGARLRGGGRPGLPGVPAQQRGPRRAHGGVHACWPRSPAHTRSAGWSSPAAAR